MTSANAEVSAQEAVLAMLTDVEPTQTDIYQALFDLSQRIANHSDLESLCEGLAQALNRILEFERFALMQYDPDTKILHVYGVTEERTTIREHELTLPLDSTPAGWVFENQQPLVIPNLENEGRWPKFVCAAQSKGLKTLALVPLTTGGRRLGVLGFGALSEYSVSDTQLTFMQRVASEFAVSVESYLTRQKLVRERDRLSALFEITNALMSKLSPGELFPAISAELAKVIAHDSAGITVLNRETDEIELIACHGVNPPEGNTPNKQGLLPMAEVIASGKPVVVTVGEFQRFESPIYHALVQEGYTAHCSLPLSTPHGVIGTLDLGRKGGATFTADEVAFGLQVARQIAIAVENAITFQELGQLRDRLATEKLYLEDEIRTDQNLGNMVGDSPAFQAVLKSVQIVAPTDATVLILGETGTGKELIARAIHDLSGRGRHNFVKATKRALSRVRRDRRSADSSSPTTGPSSSTRLGRSRWNFRPSSCAPSRSRRSSAWAAIAPSSSTCGWSRPPTAI
jgi:formate hydrogenlyase transcriptional activator